MKTVNEKIREAIARREEQAAEIREAVAKAARSSAVSNLPADDLTAIKGIGAAVAAKLEAAGIRHYEALAAATDEALEAVAKGTSKKAAKGEWRAQSETLAAAKEPVDMPEADLGMAGRITGRDLWAALDLDGSDIDNAKRMIARFEGRLVSVEGVGVLAWNGKKWSVEEDSEAQLWKAAQITSEAIGLEPAIVRIAHEHGVIEHYYTSKKDAKEKRDLLKGQGVVFCHEELAARAMTAKNLKSMTAMMKIAQKHLQASISDLDVHPHLLTVQNGTIDARTGEVLRHSYEHMITRMSPIAIPVRYDQEGRRWVDFDRSKAPLFLGGIAATMLHDPELLDYLQRLSGYMLTGETTEQRFWFLSGKGSNMKGKYCGTMERLIPEHYAELDVTFLMKQRNQKSMGGTNEDLADLRGARIIHAEEGDENDVLDEAPMKKLSGGGHLKVAKKFMSSVRFRPVGKIIYETNHKPRVISQDTAIWRRIVDIPFRAHFANPGEAGYKEGVSLPKNPNFDRDVEPELPHILAWAIMGAVRWYQVGLSDKIAEPVAIQEARKAYMEETDVLADFISATCEREEGATVLQGQLYTAYENYCALNASGNPISKKAFGSALKERLFVHFDRGGNRYRSGLRLNEAGWAYHRNERPKDRADLKVVAPEAAPEARVATCIDTSTPLRSYGVCGRLYSARSMDDLPIEVRELVRATGQDLPAPGETLKTAAGDFQCFAR